MGTVTKIKPTKLESPDIGETMIMAIHAHESGFDRVRIAAKCDHKFIDSTRCLKCGWEP